jgi:hypothetical protein
MCAHHGWGIVFGRQVSSLLLMLIYILHFKRKTAPSDRLLTHYQLPQGCPLKTFLGTVGYFRKANVKI